MKENSFPNSNDQFRLQIKETAENDDAKSIWPSTKFACIFYDFVFWIDDEFGLDVHRYCTIH